MIQTNTTGEFGTVAMARGFIENKALIILGGDDNEMTVNVICDETEGAVTVSEGALTLTFVPDADAFGFIFVPLGADVDRGHTDGE